MSVSTTTRVRRRRNDPASRVLRAEILRRLGMAELHKNIAGSLGVSVSYVHKIAQGGGLVKAYLTPEEMSRVQASRAIAFKE